MKSFPKQGITIKKEMFFKIDSIMSQIQGRAKLHYNVSNTMVIIRGFHISSHQIFGDHCKKGKPNRKTDTKRRIN